MKQLQSYRFDGPVGCVRFEEHYPGFYVTHLEFEPGSADTSTEFCRNAISAMFEQTNALIIVGWAMNDNMPARMFGHAVGYKRDRKRDTDESVCFKITIADWMKKYPDKKFKTKRPKK